MGKAICYCETNIIRAGKLSTWKFVYSSMQDLPIGTKIKFEILSEGKEIDWQIPSTTSKNNLIWGEMPNGQAIKAKGVKSSNISSYQFEFILPAKLSSNESFHIFIGTKDSKNNDKNGNRSQCYSQRKKPFYIYVDSKGKGDYKEKETILVDIKGNELKKLKIIAPSIVARNRRFDVMVRFEDEYGNLTNLAKENTLIELSYENLRENLNWKLFVPETGFLTLPNLYFNEPGIYRLQLKNLLSNEIFLSSPIKCYLESDLSIFWGLFHGENIKWNSTSEIENTLKYFRDEKNLNFYTASPFDDPKETSNDEWKKTNQILSEANEDERFTTLTGSQWVGNIYEEGLRQFIYSKDNKPLIRKKDLKNNSLKKIYKTTQSKDLHSIPSFTMGSISCFDFKDFNADFEKVVEIYNAWGSSECSEKEGNLFPIKGKNCSEDKKGSIINALNNNCRFGFIAGGLDDRGIYQRFYDTDQKQYSPGLTAIIAKNLTRDSILSALNSHSCYATTGAKIIIDFNIANMPIGSKIPTNLKPGLLYNRFISGSIIGTNDIQYIEIIRNGHVWQKIEIDKATNHYEFSIDDPSLLNEISLKSNTNELFSYYYLRILQKDGHMGWSSPIWIDIREKGILKKIPKKK